MNKFIKIPYLVLLALLFSCSDSDNGNEPGVGPNPAPDPTPSRPIVEIKMSSKKASYNIFELVDFSMRKANGETMYWGLDFIQYYDSIVWEIPKVGKVKLTDTSNDPKSRGYVSITTSWGHNFFTPQTVETFLYCYQGDSVAYKTSNTVTIKNDKDFLNFNWGDIKEPSQGGIGYVDFFQEKNHKKNNDGFINVVYFKNNIPSVSMLYKTEGETEEDGKLGKTKLYNLINELYGPVAYDESNQEVLNQKYAELFHPEEELEPCNIWITPTSRIVLAKRDETYMPYMVYAEPR